MQDPSLKNLVVTPRGKFGPDVFDPYNATWWDVTTRSGWPSHLRYWMFGEGTGLFTR
jgi:hypothetical protein